MSASLALGTIGALGCGSYGSIRTKSDVMKFALEGTVEYGDNGRVYHYDKAKELYDFFCSHVTLVDTDVVPLDELVGTILDKAKDLITELKEEAKKKA